jgi:5-keto 4-deoxyuronate isomerase
VVFGGAFLEEKELRLEGGKDFGSDVFLDRREHGIVTIDGKDYPMKKAMVSMWES